MESAICTSCFTHPQAESSNPHAPKLASRLRPLAMLAKVDKLGIMADTVAVELVDESPLSTSDGSKNSVEFAGQS